MSYCIKLVSQALKNSLPCRHEAKHIVEEYRQFANNWLRAEYSYIRVFELNYQYG
jgi:hypothetical protein